MNNGNFKEFEASELFCPNCRRAVPVRKRLLLILSSGEKYDYTCVFCNTSVGEKTSTEAKPLLIIT